MRWKELYDSQLPSFSGRCAGLSNFQLLLRQLPLLLSFLLPSNFQGRPCFLDGQVGYNVARPTSGLSSSEIQSHEAP